MLKWLLTTLVLFTISSAAQLSAQEPQIAYYTFNQTSGQTVPNLAQPGQGNNPAFLSAVPNWQSAGGPAGGVLNGYIDVSGGLNGIDTGIALATNQDFTLEFWFRKNNATGLEVFVSNNSNFYIYMDASGRIRWFIGPGETLNSATGYDDGNWHHVACTYRKRGGGDRARMYIDNEPRLTNNNVSDPAWGSNTVQLLHYTGLYPFSGDFDEFRWWDDDLNQGTIQNNDDVEQLPAQPFLYGPNLSNIPDATTYTHTDIIDNTTRTLPFEFHNGDTGGNYTGVAVSILAQNNATAIISTVPTATVIPGSFAAFDIDVTVTTVPYTIDLQIDYVHNATPQTYTWTISGATKTPLPDWLYYRFNEGSGSDVTNDAGPSVSTFSSAPTWNTTDPAVGIAAVDSATGYLDTGFDPTPMNGNDFTAEWWMRTTSSAGAQGMFSAGNDIAFGLFNGELTIRNPANYFYVNQSTTVNDGSWHHLAYVYTSATQNLAIHLDGNLIFKYAFPITFTGTNINLWRNRSSTTEPFLGEIDELRLWDGAIIPPVIGGGGGGEIVPDIVIHRPFGTVLGDSSTDTVAGAMEGSPSSLTYTVENAGDMNLDVTSATVVAVTNCSVGALSYSATIGQSATDTFIVNVTPTAGGLFTATLTVNSNDPDTPAYTITISGTAASMQDIDIQRPSATSIPSGNTDTVAGAIENAATNLLYTIENVGGLPLSISAVTGTGSATCNIVINGFPANLAASATGILDINITPLVDGAYTASFVVVSNDPDTPSYTINISGDAAGQPNLVVRDALLAVIVDGGTDTVVGAVATVTSPLTYNLENTGDLDLTGISVTVNGVPTNCSAVVSNVSATVTGGATGIFDLDLTPTSAGAFSVLLDIVTNDPDNPLYQITVDGTAIQPQDIRVQRPAGTNITVDTFAGTQVGSGAAQTYTVANIGNLPLNVSSITATASASVGAVVSNISLPANVLAAGSVTFDLTVTPTAPGAFTVTLTINSDDPDTPAWVVNISDSAAGLPVIGVDQGATNLTNPDILNPAGTIVGLPTVLPFDIRNTGNWLLNLTSGPNYVALGANSGVTVGITQPASGTIAAAGNEPFSVSFTPTATTWNFTLTIANDDPTNSSWVINVSGTALSQQDIQLSRGAVIAHTGADTFAGTNVGSPTVQTYTIDNLGDLDLDLTTITATASASVAAAISNITLPSTVVGSASTTFDLTVTPASPGAFTVTLTVNSNDPDTPAYVINISDGATGTPAIALDQGPNLNLPDPSMINRPVGLVGTAENLPFNIRNTGNWTLNLTNSAGSPVALVTTSGASIVINQPAATAISAGSNETFSIDYTPTAITWSFQLRIDNNDPTNTQWFINVSGTALRVQNIQMQRGPVISHTGTDTFAGTAVGSPTVQTYNINNIGDLDLTVSNVSTSSSANVTAAISNIGLPSTVSGLTSNTFDLTVTPNAPGAFTVTLTISSDDADTPNYVIDISGISTGIPKIAVDQGATVLANPDTVNPAGTIVGIPSVLPFDIRNTGNWNLNLTSGPTYVAQTQSGVTVNVTQPTSGLILAGNNEAFSVSFTPTSTVWNFTLTIANNDGTNNPWVINVSGTSTFRDLEIRQGATNLTNGVAHIDNSQVVGLAANLPFLLRNLGNEDVNLTGAPAVQLTASSNVSTTVNQPAGTVVSGTLPFSVDINPTAANWSFTLLVTSDDPAEPTWTVIVQGTAGIRQLQLSRTGAVPYNTSDTVSGITAGVLTDLVYTLTNTGTVAVNIPSFSVSNINLPNTNSSVNNIIQPPAVALAPAASVNFTVRVTANDTGAFDADLQLNSNTPTNSPYLWTIDGNASPGGVVDVRDGMTSLVSGIGYALPDLVVGAPATTINLDVFNAGSAWLRLNSPTPLTIINSSANLTAGIITQPTTAPINKNATSGFALSLAATSAGAYTVTLELASDDPSSPFTIILTGNVATGVIGSTPVSHNFGNVNINTSVNNVVTLNNLAGGVALTISSIVLTGDPAFSISGQNPSEVIGSGAISTSPITVTYNPTVIGAHAATLTVQSDSNGGTPHIYNIPLSGAGVAGVIGSSPASHDFGQLNINNSDNTVVTINNSGSGPLTISSITLTGGAAFSISGANPSEVIGGASSSTSPITVSFDPTVGGVQNATIVIQSDSNGGAPDIYNIALTGEGTIPTINIPTPPSTFTAQNINTGTYTQVVAIQNTGNGLLTLNSITLTGSSEFGLQGVLPGAVSAGSSVNVTIVWTPTIADILQSGTLVIDSDSGSTGTAVVTNLPFDATGTQGELTAPATVSWGPVAMIQTKQVDITVNNTGSGPLALSAASMAGINVADFTWITNPTPVVLPIGGSAIFTIEFAPSFVGSHVATLTLTNDELGNVAPQTTRIINLDADGAPPVGIANQVAAPDSGGPSEVSFDITGFPGDSVTLTVTYTGGSNPGPAFIYNTDKGTVAGNTITGLFVGDTVTFLWDLYATEFHTSANDYQLLLAPFDNTLGLPGATGTTPLLAFDRQGGFATHDLSGETPKGKFGHVLIHDSVNNNLVVFGGKHYSTLYDELWIYDIDNGNWVQVAKSGTWPPALQYSTAIYDTANHRMVVFSGSSSAGYRDETWALDLSNNTWSEIASGYKPMARFGAVLTYDAPNGRAIMHGGSNGAYLSDTWELDLTFGAEAWTELTPAGSVPAGRWGHAAALDTATPRLIIYGGKTAGGDVDEVHELNLATNTWSAPAVTGTAGTRYFMNSINDQTQNRMLVSGGYRGGSFLKDAWVLDITSYTWTKIGSDPAAADGRTVSIGAFDPATGQGYYFGGYANGTPLDEVTSVDLSGATPTFSSSDIKDRDENGPEGRWGAVSEFDDINSRLILFGGKGKNHYDGSTWALDRSTAAGQWTRIAGSGATPSLRTYAASAIDRIGNRMFVHGGGAPDGTKLDDLWVLDLSGDTWTQLSAGPSARNLHALVYDSNLDRLILFGGFDAGNLNDVWSYDIATDVWTQLTPAGTPPLGRGGTAHMYDATGNRLIIAAGQSSIGYGNDVWELDLTLGSEAWTDISAVSGSIMSGRRSMAFGDIGSDLWLQGGYSGSTNDDVWSLDTSTTPVTWVQKTITGAKPMPRFVHVGATSNTGDFYVGTGYEAGAALYDIWKIDTTGLTARPIWIPNSPRSLVTAQVAVDIANNRLIAYGGLHEHNVDHGLYALDLSTPRAEWVSIDAGGQIPQPRRAASFAYDAIGNRMVMYGGLFGESGTTKTDELWTLSLTLGSETWVQHTNATTAGQRSHHVAMIDASNSMWLIGGVNSAGNDSIDVHQLDLASMTWTAVTPTGTAPAVRSISAGIYDPVADRIVMYGGSSNGIYRNDTIMLDLSGGTPAWSTITRVGTGPAYMYYHTTVYDPTAHRMIVFGGFYTSARNDLHIFDLATDTWSQITPPVSTPQERWAHGAGWDAVNSRMVVTGGFVNGGVTNSNNEGDAVQTWFWGD